MTIVEMGFTFHISATIMKSINNRQTTIQRIKMVKKRQHMQQKGGKRVQISRRGR